LCAFKLERGGAAIQYYTDYLKGGGNEIDPEERAALQRDLLVLNGNSGNLTLTSSATDIDVTDGRAGSAAPPQSYRLEGGKLALQKLWTASAKPTALICSNDMTAIGVMREAFELGIQVPDQLSVIGFDDIRMAEFMTPPLTTIQMSQSDLASLAFTALMKEVEQKNASAEGTEYSLKTRLVLRKSTTFPPSSSKGGQKSALRSRQKR